MGKTTKDRRDTRDDDVARYMADARPWYVPTPSARTPALSRHRMRPTSGRWASMFMSQ